MLSSVCCVLLAPLLGAADPQPSATFEVVSVKPSAAKSFMEALRSGEAHSRIDDKRVDIGAFPLSGLIQLAYEMDGRRVKAPDWLKDVLFDVTAKLPEGASKQQVPAMMKAMLAERFKMVAHIEKKTVAGFALARGSGPLKLTPSTSEASQSGCPGGRDGVHNCRAMSMAGLASLLDQLSVVAGLGGSDRGVSPAEIYPNGPVIDSTQLEGRYDFTFRYGVAGGGGRGGADAGAAVEAIPVAEGLRELGLKLVPMKQEVDYLVIDHIERTPIEN